MNNKDYFSFSQTHDDEIVDNNIRFEFRETRDAKNSDMLLKVDDHMITLS